MTLLRKTFISVVAVALVAVSGSQIVRSGPAKPAPVLAMPAAAAPDLSTPQAVRALLRSGLLAERASGWACQAYATKNQRPLERAAGAADAAADYLTSQSALLSDGGLAVAALADRFSAVAIKLRAGTPKKSGLAAIDGELRELSDLSTALTTAETALWDSFLAHQAGATTPVSRAPAAEQPVRALPLAAAATAVLSLLLALLCLTAPPAQSPVSGRRETTRTLESGDFVITTSETPTGRVATGFSKRA